MRSAKLLAASARLLDVHSDPDHHRLVFTLVGEDDALVESLAAGVARAVELVTSVPTRKRTRVGAVDVVPLVPLVRRTCRGRGRRRSRWQTASAAGLSVLFYGRLTEDGREPAFFRGGGTDELSGGSPRRARPRPRPARLHPTAGAVLVGVRRPLIAFNVNLRTDDVEAARAIARLVRERDGGFLGVRALGLALPQAGLVQVSMNVTDWEAAALHEIARDRRGGRGARGGRGRDEPAGLMPAGAAVEAAGAAFGIEVLTGATCSSSGSWTTDR